MMNWDQMTAAVQVTVDGRYTIKSTSEGWGAYDTSLPHAAREIGIRDTDLKARAVCEAEEARLMASMRRRA